ncbi:DUF3040 domain-containing protein [Streptomyces arenae]|nr:DUF3040 domain-containing protein [Streptomyces arenae]
MLHSDDSRLATIASRLEADDPEFARAMSQGRPYRPREYDRRGTWAVLALMLALLAVGIVIAHGVLIATALVGAGATCHHFDRPKGDDR